MSGLSIAIMILRIKRNPDSSKSKFETTALRITGTAFILLSISLFAGAVLNILFHREPETTLRGVIISVVSIVIMSWLMVSKKTAGRKLHSDPILADADCTKVCIYMSVVLLVSSIVYELTDYRYADVIGVGGLIYFSLKEGVESLGKAAGKKKVTIV
jgi:divalent metal cation (Fe/Co/Zn/Cd) transporter